MFTTLPCIATISYITTPLAVLGAASLVMLVGSVAIPIIKKLSIKLYNSPFVTNMRALFCRVCAFEHKFHEDDKKSVYIPTIFSQTKKNDALKDSLEIFKDK